MELFLRRFGIYLIAIVLAISFFKVNGFFSNKKSEIIKSDGLGYYSYLPAMFIYGDYSQGFVNEKFPKYYKYNGLPEYMQTIDNKQVDKYFFGTAILMYPFFITAHTLSIYFRQAADGYSVLYQYFIGLAAVFYVFLGIFFCNKLLRLYGASTYHSIFICTLLVFGTNIFYYVVVEPSMSHVFSFAMISAFLFYTKSLIEFQKTKYIIPAFIAIAMVTVIRPFNLMIILAIPFLSGSISKLIETIKFLFRNYLFTLSAAVIAFLIVSLQAMIWYKQTGHFIVYSYTYERFYFDKPNFMNVLFSYKKGLFIYTPIFFFALFGFIRLFRKNRFEATSLFLFFVFLAYVMGCWHQWYYGSSFGFRPMVEYFPLFAILLLFSFSLFKKKIFKVSFIILCTFTIYVNQIQAYQYRKFILHWDQMTKYKYWRVFLKTDDKWIGYVWENPEPADIYGTTVREIETDFEKPEKEWSGAAQVDVGNKAHSGKMVSALDPNTTFSNTLILRSNKELMQCKKPALVVTGYLNDKNRLPSDKLQLIVSYDKSDGGTYFYKPRMIDNFVDWKKGWKRFEVAVRLDKLNSENDVVKVYFWNAEKGVFLIDDVDIQFIDQL